MRCAVDEDVSHEEGSSGNTSMASGNSDVIVVDEDDSTNKEDASGSTGNVSPLLMVSPLRRSNKAKHNIITVSTIEVKGSGSSEVNGFYEKVTGIVNGYECFVHKGHSWRGTLLVAAEDFVIYHKDEHWYIGRWQGDVRTATGCPAAPLYRTLYDSRSKMPPNTGWISMDIGLASARGMTLSRVFSLLT